MAHKKTWFITGASRGFGLDITKAVLATGDQVIATVRSKGEELARQFDKHPGLLVVTLDVTNEAQVQAGIQTGIDKFGKIDVLVNNAGYGLLSGVEEATDAEVKANYEVNVFGTLNVIRAVLPFMRKAGAGHIINISSVGGLSGAFPGWGLYCSTKFAIEGITEALALEVAPLGIKATVVSPGFFRTNFLDQSSLISSAQQIGDYKKTVGAVRDFAAQINYKQPGDPQKLALAFVQLASSANPPVHLLLGNDTLAMYREKTKALENDIENWYETTTGTDHDDVAKK
ncbi:oxidoreductase [Chitinophaga silvisoli]|uniref:SDR family NAD(P)-dependent oxidoreductase n=1 Tax=Chitinophaga silvisoli TaxID=2291814 RepID=A0A3E1P1K6_9BACT|nr:oxidoreductase [Chitinophaga silvisoli]RFM34034.1 SDR family NAD(P)-dependent oxidoreductase [Chitinophaga silvisoli]